MYTINIIEGKLPAKIRDYATIEQEVMVKEKYGPYEQIFERPTLLTKGPHGELIVGNNSKTAKHVVLFDEELQYSRAISARAYEENFDGDIRGVAIDMGGFLYVTDSKAHCIKKFTLHDGKFISQFGREGPQNGQFRGPAGLLFSKSNLLYVCDRLNHRIQVFHGTDFLFKFGEFAGMREPGNFIEPVDLTMDNDEQQLFITDYRCNRVQVFKPNGEFLRLIPDTPDSISLLYPNGIFFTPDDHLLVSSTDRVLIFKKDGTFVSAIKGKYKDTERFRDCIGVIMMNDGKIVVTDGQRGTNRLIIF